jgi:hypothetical protein
MLGLPQAGRKTEFDTYLLKAASPADRATLNFRIRPFGFPCGQLSVVLAGDDRPNGVPLVGTICGYSPNRN